MGRLKKVANGDVEKAKELLRKIENSSKDLKEYYYVLFNNLNILFENYPSLYKQIEMIIKLPNNEDAKTIAMLCSELEDLMLHFEDDEYLKGYL